MTIAMEIILIVICCISFAFHLFFGFFCLCDCFMKPDSLKRMLKKLKIPFSANKITAFFLIFGVLSYISWMLLYLYF